MEQHTIADDLAAEVRDACLGMRVARLHRVVARLYEQALQTGGSPSPRPPVASSTPSQHEAVAAAVASADAQSPRPVDEHARSSRRPPILSAGS
jgi:hypothetical protein